MEQKDRQKVKNSKNLLENQRSDSSSEDEAPAQTNIVYNPNLPVHYPNQVQLIGIPVIFNATQLQFPQDQITSNSLNSKLPMTESHKKKPNHSIPVGFSGNIPTRPKLLTPNPKTHSQASQTDDQEAHSNLVESRQSYSSHTLKTKPTRNNQSAFIPIASTSYNSQENNSHNDNKRRVVISFRWTPKISLDKLFTVDSSSEASGGSKAADDDESGGSPATIVQSVASSSRHSKSFLSNKSVAGSEATDLVQPQIKPLPDIR